MAIDYYAVGSRIRKIRLEKSITQEELAFDVNTSAAYISNIEHGHKKPSLEKLTQIADVLGVTINDLCYPAPLLPPGSNAHDINELFMLCTPEKRQILLDSIGNLIETFITP